MQSRTEPTLLHHFFEAELGRSADAVAAEFVERDQRLTYRQLDDLSTHLAHRLRALGVGKDARVALYLPRGLEPYVAILGILKAGGAYVPLSPEFPDDRVRFTIEDSDAKVVITSRAVSTAAVDGATLVYAEDFSPTGPLADAPAPPLAVDIAPEDLCYVIYTSGTTGRPKGVCISHVNAVAYLSAMLQVYGVRPTDRVLQGFSLAFDASVEELWMAFASGATLVVGTQDTMRNVDELPLKLRDLGITVFSTVPTLLAALDAHDQPQLRILLFGGEAARADIIEKWASAGRWLFNGYGPTETTVVATYAWCAPGKSVTIGRPLPGYSIAILDEERRPVPHGQEGELCVGGPAVSLRGYLNRAELNEQKFFEQDGVRWYRTGDVVYQNAEGDLVFCGRIDAQVKIRGYRVELEEIEAQLTRELAALPDKGQCQGVIVALHKDEAGLPQLVAYLQQRELAEVPLCDVLRNLRKTLPAYMVPAHFASIAPSAVPRLTSGKVDRKNLPPLWAVPVLSVAGAVDDAGEEEAPPESEGERKILAVWRDKLGHPRMRRDDSFFDFGGNSVQAAEVISRFRQDPDLVVLAIRDIYERPTTRQLGERLEERLRLRRAREAAPHERGSRKRPPPHRAPRGEFLRTAALQGGLLAGLFFVGVAILWIALYYLVYGLYLAYQHWDAVSAWLTDHAVLMWTLVGVSALVGPLLAFAIPILLTITVRRLFFRKLVPGDYPMWSSGYLRWWLANLMLAPGRALASSFIGTPFAAFFYRMIGARVGRGVYLGVALDDPELLTIEDGATISDHAHLRTHALQGGYLKLRRIHIGKDCFVGSQAVVGGGVKMGDGTKLHPLSCLVEGEVTPARSEWRGSPAQAVRPGETRLSQILAHHERTAKPEDGWQRFWPMLRVFLWQYFYGWLFGLFAVLPFAAEIGLYYGLGLFRGDLPIGIFLALAVPWSAFRFYVALGFIILGKWVVTGRARPGTIALSHREYAKRWLCNRMMTALVDPQGTRGVTETLLMPHVMRWLGAKVGRRAEISDASGFQPDLLEIGGGSMLADRCVLGVPVVYRGLMTLGPVRVGEKTFVANGAHVPISTPNMNDGCLLGVLSLPPDEMEAGSDWLGSPPMRLPARDRRAPPDELTFNPPRHLVLGRAFSNFWKMVLPGTLFELLFWTTAWALLRIGLDLGLGALFWLTPCVLAATNVVAFCLPPMLKWLLVGRYRAGERFLWTPFMWRIEIVYEVELYVMSLFGNAINGTPFYAWFYRLMGSKIGRQVCILGGSLMEADLIRVDDHVTVEGFLQTHLFEDRVMKLGPIHLQEGCSVGQEGCVLYGSRMGESSSLGDLSLIMKYESFLPDRAYRGLPADEVRD